MPNGFTHTKVRSGFGVCGTGPLATLYTLWTPVNGLNACSVLIAWSFRFRRQMTVYYQRPWDIVYSEEGMMLNGAHLLVHALGSVFSLLIIGLSPAQFIQLCHVLAE